MLSFIKQLCLTVILDSFSIFALHSLFSFQCAWAPSLIEMGAKPSSGTGGGEYRARTCDPLRARQVLSQLS